MKILISPAKTLNETIAETKFELTTPQFAKEAGKLASKLKKLKPKAIGELMHVSVQISELNAMRFKNWHLADQQTEDVHPAGWMFAGDVYRGLDFASLSEKDQEAAQHTLRILSGMYGILRPFDLIYPYRLEMGTHFSTGAKAANLYEFWGDKLRKAIEKETAKDELVVNLASNEYSKAAQLPKMKRKVISPVFKELKDGEYKMIAIFAKIARGTMSRFLIETRAESVEDILEFDREGYKYMANLSTETEPVFVR